MKQMSGDQIKEKLNLYLDNMLSQDEKMKIKKHLNKCKNCADELKALTEIGSLLKEIPVPQARVDFSAEFEQAVSISPLLKEIPVPPARVDFSAAFEETIGLCPEIEKKLSLYLDSLLGIEEKGAVEKHLKICSQCREQLADLHTLNSLLREIPVPAAASDLSLRIEKLLLPERRNVWKDLLPSRYLPERYIPQVRWAVFTGVAAAVLLLASLTLWRSGIVVRLSTPEKKIPAPQLPQPVIVPTPVPVPKITVPHRKVAEEVTVKPKAPGSAVALHEGEPQPELPTPKVKVVKPKTLHFLNETKPQTEIILPLTLSREASFTTLSFLPREEQIYTTLYDGQHLWLGLFSSPAKLVKVDQQGNYTIYTCATGDDNATSMVYAQGSLWVGLDSVPLKILKVNPEDGSYKSYLLKESVFPDDTGGIRKAVTFDGKYLWFGLWTKPARLVRINPEDLSYQIYTCKEGEDNPSFALFDGKNVWFGLYTAPGKYLKVNPQDGTYLTYALKEGENYIKTGAYDGQNIWFGLETSPGKLAKVNPFDGTVYVYNLREDENIITAGTFAQRYLWFSVASEPTKILQINPYTGNYITYTRGEIKNISSASFDGRNLWFPDKSGRLLKVSL